MWGWGWEWMSVSNSGSGISSSDSGIAWNWQVSLKWIPEFLGINRNDFGIEWNWVGRNSGIDGIDSGAESIPQCSTSRNRMYSQKFRSSIKQKQTNKSHFNLLVVAGSCIRTSLNINIQFIDNIYEQNLQNWKKFHKYSTLRNIYLFSLCMF
jgi:hypothetical protein